MTSYNGNTLYGKKWAVCGDSFTAGVTGTPITEGRFKGCNIAYPYLIAERNNMELISFFQGGRCIAYPADGTFHNSLTDPNADCYYRNIPEGMSTISQSIWASMIPITSTAKAATEKTRPVSSR